MTLNLLSSSDPALLSNLKAFLDSSHPPNKQLSQNFLIDRNILDKIIQVSNLSPKDSVCEIGSGPGALTKALLDHGTKVIAVEKDRVFAKELSRFQTAQNSLLVVEGDFLKFDLDQYFSKEARCKILGNLPYHLTTPILKKIRAHHSCIETATVMIQKEVAEKLTSKKIQSAFQLELLIFAELELCFSIPKGCFYPVPGVTSAVLQINFRSKVIESPEDLIEIAQVAFRQKRKQLKSSLKQLQTPENITSILQSMGKSTQCRPEELSLEEWVQFGRLMKKLTEPSFHSV